MVNVKFYNFSNVCCAIWIYFGCIYESMLRDIINSRKYKYIFFINALKTSSNLFSWNAPVSIDSIEIYRYPLMEISIAKASTEKKMVLLTPKYWNPIWIPYYFYDFSTDFPYEFVILHNNEVRCWRNNWIHLAPIRILLFRWIFISSGSSISLNCQCHRNTLVTIATI